MPLAFAPPWWYTDALEVAFDRYLVPSRYVTGVIAFKAIISLRNRPPSSMPLLAPKTERFLADNGRRPLILIAKMGGWTRSRRESDRQRPIPISVSA